MVELVLEEQVIGSAYFEALVMARELAEALEGDVYIVYSHDPDNQCGIPVGYHMIPLKSSKFGEYKSACSLKGVAHYLEGSQ